MMRQMKLLKKPFQSILSTYQIGLENSMKGSEFVFDCVHLLYQNCHKINPNLGGSCMDYPNWMKKSYNKSRQ